jgi:ABC-type lipoprotein release transport system permease subunit
MIARMAWRNLWRNTRRTLLTIAVIGIGLSVLQAFFSYLEGMKRTIHREVAESNLGHIQVHHPQYRDLRQLHLTLPHGMALAERLEALDGVALVRPRIITSASLRSSTSSYVQVVPLVGLDREREVRVHKLARSVVEGGFVVPPPEATAPDAPARYRSRRGITLGRKLAQLLDVQLGSKIRIDTAGFDEPTCSSAFWVTGIIDTGTPTLDRAIALVSLADLQAVVGAGDQVHELTVQLDDPALVPATLDRVREALADLQLPVDALGTGDFGWNAAVQAPEPAPPEVAPWWEISPELKAILDMWGGIMGFMYFLMLAIMSAGILTTLFMIIHERRREFGIQLSMGTSPVRLFSGVMVETVFLALLSVAAGSTLGGLWVWLLTEYGIDLRWFMGSMQFGSITIDMLLKGAMEPRIFTEPATVVFLAALLFALTPARHVARMRPLDGIAEK